MSEAYHNSLELVNRVSKRLGYNQEQNLILYKELSQVPEGAVKKALDDLLNTGSKAHEEVSGKDTLKLNLSCPNCGNTTWMETVDGGDQCFECMACGEMYDPESMCTNAVPAQTPGKTKSELNKYAACIKGTCVRDAQYSQWEDASPIDDEAWKDAPIKETPIFLEIVEADSPTRAKQIAATHIGVSENVIELYPVN